MCKASADDDATDKNGVPKSSIARSLPNNGDPNGTRASLAAHGITYGLTYTGELLGNVSGGVQRETVYEGRLDAYVTADLEKLLGVQDLTFYASGSQIHGTGGIRRDSVPTFATLSNIEALPSTRLFELWLEQKFANNKVALRFGQLAVDSEFFISSYSTVFLTSGWPAITGMDLPSSGASWPMATPAVRLKVEPDKNWAFLIGLFNGDPAGPGPGDPQERDRSGTAFRVNDPPFLIGEVQYGYNQDANAKGLAGMVKLGAWHHFGKFDDQRFDANGLSLANPASNGMPARLRGDDGIYAGIDQQIYRPPKGDADSGIGLFARISASPSDRNIINFYADGGIVFSGMIPGRPDDKFGASVLYSHVSDAARALSVDQNVFGNLRPIRDYEMVLELTYQMQIVPGWTVQPDFQYVMHPSGHEANLLMPSIAIKDAAIFGLRTTIQY